MTEGRDRRSVLRAGVALCSVGLAGCVNGGGGGSEDGSPNGTDGSGPDDPEPPEPEPVTSWPMQQYDAGNTAAVPKAEAPEDGVDELWRKDLGERIRSSPVVADGMIYVRDHTGTVHALDETGDEQWTASVPDGELTTTPAIYEDLLLVPHDEGVVAFDRNGGTEEWEYTSEAGTTDLTVADDAVFFADTRTGVHAVEARTGDDRWTYRLNPSNGFFTHPAAVDDGRAYVPTAANDRTDSREIFSFGTESGDDESIFQTEEYGFSAGLSIDDGRIFAPTPGGVRAYDRDGNEQWHFPTGSPIKGDLAVTDGIVYGSTIGNNQLGRLYALEVIDGRERWSAGTRIWYDTGPVIVGSDLVFGNAEDSIIAYDRNSGVDNWQVDAPFARFQQGAYANGQFYFAASNGDLIAVGES
jgi:outer membrane protein assembly factor BamB